MSDEPEHDRRKEPSSGPTAATVPAVALTLLLFRLFVASMVVGWAPYSIVTANPKGSAIQMDWLTLLGIVLIAVGAAVYVRCAWDFARFGRSFDPSVIVARGAYRGVRHPMYASLVLILLGESVIFRSWTLLGYALVIWGLLHLLVCFYEERALGKKFGISYEQYRKDVPRWIPRIRTSFTQG